jgi:hypothetical protein
MFGLSKLTFSDISDDDLDRVVNNICHDFPQCGENTLKQIIFRHHCIRDPMR